jgi:hypothetical protein
MCHDLSSFFLIGGIRQQGDVACAFDGLSQHALVNGTIPGNSTGQNLAALGHVVRQQPQVLEVNDVDLLDAEAANAATVHAAATSARTPAAITIVVAVIAALAIIVIAISISIFVIS